VRAARNERSSIIRKNRVDQYNALTQTLITGQLNPELIIPETIFKFDHIIKKFCYLYENVSLVSRNKNNNIILEIC